MRLALIAAAGALLVAGCDSGEVPSPAERQQGEAAPAPVSEKRVVLQSEGLTAGTEAFYFAAGRSEVEAALVKTLGPVLRSGENAECGAGPIVFTDFAGGLTVHFQDDRLVGWNWHLAQDGDAPATGTVIMPGKVQVGVARAVAEAAPGFAPVENSTLGEEFALGNSIGGFIAGDKVEMLYAGTQCFFR